jgi:hypothetical protein
LSKLSADHAEKIARKLGAELKEGRHQRAYIRWQGTLVAHFGIRRSSREVGHDYIPREIFVTMRQALDLARCPLSAEDYFNILRLHGRLPT